MRRCTKEESIKANSLTNLSKFATTFVLFYLQSNGQTLEQRLKLLNQAVNIAGIKAEFVQVGDKSGWKGNNIKQLEMARDFRAELERNFPIGSFEAEVCSVMNTISKYQDKTATKFQKFLRRLKS